MRFGRCCAMLALTGALAACGGDTGPENVSPVGSFALISVNGHALPASFAANPTGTPWYTRGALTVKADGSYSLTLSDSTTCCGNGTIDEAGTWSIVAGDSIRFAASTANRPTGNGTFSSGVVTRKIFLDVFAWRRQ